MLKSTPRRPLDESSKMRRGGVGCGPRDPKLQIGYVQAVPLAPARRVHDSARTACGSCPGAFGFAPQRRPIVHRSLLHSVGMQKSQASGPQAGMRGENTIKKGHAATGIPRIWRINILRQGHGLGLWLTTVSWTARCAREDSAAVLAICAQPGHVASVIRMLIMLCCHYH